MRFLLLALAACIAALAQQSRLPRFEQFAVPVEYNGHVASPRLERGEELDLRCFGASRDEQRKFLREMKVNFAGRYVVQTCTCGTSCHYFWIWDARSGAQVNSPIKNLSWPFGSEYPAGFSPAAKRYLPNSRLFKVEGCVDWDWEPGVQPDCGKFFYELRGRQLVLLKKIPLRVPRLR